MHDLVSALFDPRCATSLLVVEGEYTVCMEVLYLQAKGWLRLGVARNLYDVQSQYKQRTIQFYRTFHEDHL